MQNLLDHLRTERAPVRLSELLADMRSMGHVPGFPTSPGELRDQLDALTKAGLVRCFEKDQEEWVEVRPAGMPQPERTLF